MGEALKIEDLSVEFRSPAGTVRALNGVSLTQEEGEIYCVVGESGAGKSTLALAIMGLLPHNSSVLGGRIYFQGVDLMRAGQDYMRSLRGHEVSMVFQDAQAALNPVEPVGSQLEEVVLQHSDISIRNANRMAQRDAARDGPSRPQEGDGSVSLFPQWRNVPAGDDGDCPGAEAQAADRR